MDLKKFQPLLAGTVTDLEKLRFPLIASPKLDGIRCVVVNGKALSRNLKPIPNKFIREYIEGLLLDNVDGEIMLNGKDFNSIQSAVMSFDGEPDFVYMIFDTIEDEPYKIRIANRWPSDRVKQLKAKYIFSLEELIAQEDEWVKEGYEGIMLRDPMGRYKFGRSTEKEGILLKLKRFHDTEALVVGFEEKLHNDNVQEKDEKGYAKRSSAKAGMIPAGTLGALIVVIPGVNNLDVKFKIGTGFDDEQRKEIWDNKDNYLNKTVTFKFQEISKYDVPRFPVFKHFRLPE